MASRLWQKVGATWWSGGSYDAALPVAMFDFDSTLHEYKKRGPPKELTLAFLTRLASEFNLVIISNRSSDKASAFAPVRDYVAELDSATTSRVTVYGPTTHDRYRKPHTGTWEHYVRRVCNGKALTNFVFYCGDAAGRPGDHSNADAMYARNIGVNFITPEALFYGGSDPWSEPIPAPTLALPTGDVASTKIQNITSMPHPCVIIMVGSPASGKSRIANAIATARNCVHLSYDTHKTTFDSLFATATAAKHSIVVDNTNPTAEARAGFVKKGYHIVVCQVTTPRELCFHLNSARCQIDTTGSTKELPAVAIHTYWKRLAPPTEAEIAQYRAAPGVLSATLIEVPFELAKDASDEVTRMRYSHK